MSDAGPKASRDPSLAELLRATMDCHDLEVHTSLPCRVEKFDPATQTADLKPLIRRRAQNPDGTEINESIPVIPRVPVAWPRAGKFIITWPIKKGDLVEIVISESSRDTFQAGDGVEADPDDFRRFDLSDAWAYPAAGYPDNIAIENFDPDDLVIGVDGGVVIHVKESGEIHLGSKDAADALALASLVKTELDAVKADQDALKILLAGHVHPGVTAGGASTAVSTDFTGYTPHTPADVGSDVVKSD